MDAAQRANILWKEHLETYEDPGLDPAIDEELQTYIAKTKEEIGEAAYF